MYKKHAVANNKYIPETYDSSKTNKFLTYLDANNLYGWAMSKCMPYANFAWKNPDDNFNIFDIADDSPIGYILEVDVEYPYHLHDYHSDLPFLPVNECVKNTKQNKLNRNRLHFHTVMFSLLRYLEAYIYVVANWPKR